MHKCEAEPWCIKVSTMDLLLLYRILITNIGCLIDTVPVIYDITVNKFIEQIKQRTGVTTMNKTNKIINKSFRSRNQSLLSSNSSTSNLLRTDIIDELSPDSSKHYFNESDV